MKQLYVYPDAGAPIRSPDAVCGLKEAVAAARRLEGHVELHLMPGEHRLDEPLRLDEQDSGLSLIGHDAVITGVRPITDWHDAGDGIVYAEVPSDYRFTQFYVDGERRERARYPESGFLSPAGKPADSSGWANDTSGHSDEELAKRFLYFNPGDIPHELYRPEDVEFVILQFWMEARLYLEDWNPAAGEALMKTGSWRTLTWSYGYYLENVRDGLKTPGSWYHDRKENRVYYHLRDDENGKDLRGAVPVLRTLIELAPARGHKVSDLRFEGITFPGRTGMRAERPITVRRPNTTRRLRFA